MLWSPMSWAPIPIPDFNLLSLLLDFRALLWVMTLTRLDGTDSQSPSAPPRIVLAITASRYHSRLLASAFWVMESRRTATECESGSPWGQGGRSDCRVYQMTADSIVYHIGSLRPPHQESVATMTFPSRPRQSCHYNVLRSQYIISGFNNCNVRPLSVASQQSVSVPSVLLSASLA
jgi:hypothetical protein